MNKKLVLMCGPLNTRSGYGDHARSIFWTLYDSNKYDIKVIDVRWGNTPRNFLKKNDLKHKQILDSIIDGYKLDRQPDIYIDIRIPNEWQQVGKFNIGITAGIETNAVSAKWIEGCNKMDLIIVPSEHSKSGFLVSVYDKVQNMPDGSQQKVGEHKLEKPIEVIFEGIDEEVYKPLKVKDISRNILKYINDIIDEDFAFLFVGQWIQGGYGEDRKDISRLIKIFYESFANLKKKPALILKTSGATFSLLDKSETISKIMEIKDKFPSDWNLPNVYLLHGDLTDDEMNELYNHPKIKCMVSLTHGEGFGRPFLEASIVGLPIIASNWSGHIDFLESKYVMFVNGELVKVPKSVVWEDIIIPESQWFMTNEHEVYKALKYAFENKYLIKEKAKNLMEKHRKTLTLNKMGELINDVVEKYTKHLSTPVSLKLPKLKKINSSKNKEKIEIPKLKKVI